MTDSLTLFTITDLKQYMYCPRICFYHTCLPDIRPVTAKMRHGITAHDEEKRRAVRRTLGKYHAVDGTRYFDVGVISQRLNLSGAVDEVVETDNGLFPIDYKLAKTAGQHYKIQLTAYAMLLEEQTETSITLGYLWLMQSRRMVTVRFTEELRQTVEEALQHMHMIVRDELLPAPTTVQPRCIDCEFRRFCNDI